MKKKEIYFEFINDFKAEVDAEKFAARPSKRHFSPKAFLGLV